MKKIVILGSTGSIGTQTIDVVNTVGCAKIVGLASNENIDLLEKQILDVCPLKVAVYNKEKAKELRLRLRQSMPGSGIEVLEGIEGVLEIAAMHEAEMVVNAMVGNIGLRPTMLAISKGKDIALANKETLVTAGEIVVPFAREKGVNVFPIDSEHSAIFQCLQGNMMNKIRNIYLTASGGPFRSKTPEELEKVTVSDALKHPNWSMGAKITIDSASMMNKGLEVIEAKWLFDVELDQVKVVVHPQSIIHSMVEYEDGSIMAQMGMPDMRVPIQYSLTYPKHVPNDFKKLDLFECVQLTFEKPKREMFPCLDLAYEASKIGGVIPAVMNAANESAVSMFLENKIRFVEIPKKIESAMSAYIGPKTCNLDNVLEADRWARDFTLIH